jgi:hypothetical protein
MATILITTILPIFLTEEDRVLITEGIFLEVTIIVIIYSLTVATITIIIEAIICLETMEEITYFPIKITIIITTTMETMVETISLEITIKTMDIIKTICLTISWVLR